MIKPTDEMRAAFLADHEDACDGIGCGRQACLDVRLAAVLAIVERDYFLEQCGRHDDHGRHVWVNPGMYADRQCEGRS